MPATTHQPASVRGSHETPELVCAEVWGGNRPIRAPFDLPGIRGLVYSQPCDGGRGGDIHYVSICSSGLLSRLCVADVAGHGDRVSAISGEIHRLLRRYMNTLDQRRVLRDLNNWLNNSERGVMTTAAAISYFPPIRLLSVSYAGHPPAWFYDGTTAQWERLRVESPPASERRLVDLPLAADAETAFSRRKRRVNPGDRLFVVTDGVLEAPNDAGEFFGEQRLEALLRQQGAAQLDHLAEAILQAVRQHTGHPALAHDDVTLMLAEFVPGPPAMGIWELIRNRFIRPLQSSHRRKRAS